MRLPSTKSLALLAGAVVFSASTFIGTASAASVTTQPVGYITLEIPSNGEGVISAAFHQTPSFVGIVGEIVDSSTIKLQGADFGGQNFADEDSPHYILVSSGDKEGVWALVDSNTIDSLSLSFVSEDLGDVEGDRVEVGDSVKVIPLWTLAKLLPESSIPEGSQVLLFDRDATGTNKSASEVFTQYAGFGWFSSVDGNNEFIYPDESFRLRSPSDAPIILTQSGAVVVNKVRFSILHAESGGTKEVFMTTGLPTSVSIGDFLNLGAAADGDQVLFFGNSTPGRNKSAEFVATYYDGFGWYTSEEANDIQIEPGQGFIYRKSGQNLDNLVIQYVPDYLSTL